MFLRKRRVGVGPTRGLRGAAGVALLCLAATPAAAQLDGTVPADLEQVGIDQNLDAALPLDLRFIDQDGNSVTLGDSFEDGKPVILTLVYYRCPMLCTLVLDGMVDALREIDWVPGDQFRIVSVSINPREEPQMALEKKQNYIRSYGKPGAEEGWQFLTGDEPSIRKLADTVGFHYQYLEDSGDYAHAAALFVITPEGRVSRYLFGVRHDPRTVRLSLVEASEGKIGSALDKFLLYCYRYDAEEGRYAPMAMKIMRVGALAVALALGLMLLSFWRREARLKRLA